MGKIFTFLIVLLYLNCFSGNQWMGKKKSHHPHATSLNDSNQYRKLRCGLYINLKGDIAFKSSHLSNESGKWKTTYIANLRNDARDLKSIVDTETFEFLNKFYSKDKNYIYIIFYTTDGANINLAKGMDHGSFQPYGKSDYGYDKKKIYFRNEVVKKADKKTFMIFERNGAFFAQDKNNYYFYGAKLTEKEMGKYGFTKY